MPLLSERFHLTPTDVKAMSLGDLRPYLEALNNG